MITSGEYAHESWCPHCKVTHPPERKVCLHCGGPVMTHRSAAGPAAPPIPPPTRRGPFGMPVPAEQEQPDEQAKRAANPLRFGFAAIWIVLGVVTALLRACSERG